MKEQAIELLKAHGKELGIKIIDLTGKTLIQFAEQLMTENRKKVIHVKPVEPIDVQKIRKHMQESEVTIKPL